MYSIHSALVRCQAWVHSVRRDADGEGMLMVQKACMDSRSCCNSSADADSDAILIGTLMPHYYKPSNGQPDCHWL